MAGQASLPIQFKKLYAGPINPDSVFATYEAAVEYAAGPLGGPGEQISVKNDDGTYQGYIINSDKSISPMGKDTTELENSLVWNEL